jgi:hypothetical protein
MFSLLAIVVTFLLLGSALLWRAVRGLSVRRTDAAVVCRGAWRSSASSIARLFPSRAALKIARNRPPGAT